MRTTRYHLIDYDGDGGRSHLAYCRTIILHTSYYNFHCLSVFKASRFEVRIRWHRRNECLPHPSFSLQVSLLTPCHVSSSQDLTSFSFSGSFFGLLQPLWSCAGQSQFFTAHAGVRVSAGLRSPVTYGRLSHSHQRQRQRHHHFSTIRLTLRYL